MLVRPVDTGIRRDGNTTRLVDYYIQLFFQTRYTIGQIVVCESDPDPKMQRIKTEHLWKKLAARMYGEYQEILNDIKVDKDKFIIKWKK
jgi:hypothetical protein